MASIKSALINFHISKFQGFMRLMIILILAFSHSVVGFSQVYKHQVDKDKNAYHRSPYLSHDRVLLKKSFQSQGEWYDMYWVDDVRPMSNDKETLYVKDVYIVPQKWMDKDGNGVYRVYPPLLHRIFYHDIKDEFVGALVKEKEDNQNTYCYEIRLPDDISNMLMDLVKGRTKFKIVPGQKLDRIFGGANMILVNIPDLIKRTYISDFDKKYPLH
ncbi:MAG: hypothetical protein K2M11_07535 [Paramuribaculum sp.]|nr:hypothetical protein [Paramuribaculum sp.]